MVNPRLPAGVRLECRTPWFAR